ncbi:MAG: hypothetical protein WBF32_05490, partial [Candidatus Aminicenantaceae bacterium]
MEDRLKKRLLKTFDAVPPLKRIMISKDPFEKKRKRIRELLTKMLIDSFEENPDESSLKWILRRDAILVFSNIISRRSAVLAEFSFLKYIDDLIHDKR